MDKPIIKTMDQRLDEAEKLYVNGLLTTLEKVGEIIVDAIDADPDEFYERIKNRTSLMWNRQAVAILEKIGRHQLHSKLALEVSTGADRLKKLPFSLQEKYLTQPFEVLTLNDDGSTDKLLVALNDLTKAQAAQMFDRDSVRSLPAQRAWLESERARLTAMAKPVADMPYKIVGKELRVLGPYTFHARELIRILSEIQ